MTSPEAKKLDSTLRYEQIDRDLFVKTLQNADPKLDKFAKTFVAKADMIGCWDSCYGFVDDGEVAAAIITTISKRTPKVANLQLLHTFARHRKQGLAALLVRLSVSNAHRDGAEYWRVSSEADARAFYEKVGIKFWGKQKSGSFLCIAKLGGITVEDLQYSISDDVIFNAVNSKRKGGCVDVFADMPKLLDLDEWITG
jgi:GNAT superfamily N-acetyltransferase